MPVDVVIIGAGAAGLAAGACLQHEGHAPVLLERDDRIGGTWDRRYERLCLHTTRRFSGLPFYPIPASYPRYVPARCYADYLREYAVQMRLDVRCSQVVDAVQRSSDGDLIISTPQRAWRARAVIVATGRHGRPYQPAWPGKEAYRGTLLHAANYRSGRDFAGLRALVIGLGNSGAEIAVDLIESGEAHVSVAVRSAPPISARDIVGIPIQLLGMVLAPVPPPIADWLGTLSRRAAHGDLRRYGLPAESWGPFSAKRPPVIDAGFLDALKAGTVSVKPAVEAFGPEGVRFADGRAEPFDVVITATGYTTGLEQFVHVPDAVDAGGSPRLDAGPRTGVFFAGYTESPRGQLFEASRGARPLARNVIRYLERSS